MIDIHRLRILREVAQHGSFSRAAAQLLLTPSAVSQQIATLERTLGTPVVDRSTRGVVLTEPGRLLVEAAEVIAAELQHAQDRIDRLTTGRTRLTIATFTSGGQHLLPGALTRFVAKHPTVELTIVEHEPEHSLPLVRDGRADLALAYYFDAPLPFQPGERSGLGWTQLQEDPLWMVLPRQHPLAGRDSLNLAELADQPWVLGCLKTEAFLRRYAESAGLSLRVVANTSDYFFALALVAAGVGVSLVPQLSLGPSAAAVVAIPVEPPRPARYLGVITARNRQLPEVDALVIALQQSAAERAAADIHLR